MLQRRYDRGETFSIRLNMNAKQYNDTMSRNVVAEIRGSERPNETVIFGAHIDAWDVGTGSLDDGAGCMIAWQALSIIKQLNLRPKRTLRVVFWTAEEMGFAGGMGYHRRHIEDGKNTVSLIMESDHGVFKPRGLKFTGSPLATEIMQKILRTMSDIGADQLTGDGQSSDTTWWLADGVPGAELYSYNENYHIWHHSRGDSMTVLNADDLDLATSLWASVVYTVAGLDDVLPRNNYVMPAVTSSNVTSYYEILCPSVAVTMAAVLLTGFID
jgi:carboxypeptidase Q